jgi:TonB family protein
MNAFRTHSLLSLLLCLFFSPLLNAQSNSDHPQELLLLDPATVYSFRGLDGQGFLRRSPVNIPEPVYQGQRTGLVVLLFVISPSGQVSQAELEPNQHGLATIDMIRAAKAAVMQWKFNPLPNTQRQSDQKVRVLIQFNRPGSGRMFSEEGNVIIEGLQQRRALYLQSSGHQAMTGGIVTAEVTLNPMGQVAWVDRYYGASPEEKVNPHLGLRTHQALAQWQFAPSGDDQALQTIKVTFRYLADQAFQPASARVEAVSTP